MFVSDCKVKTKAFSGDDEGRQVMNSKLSQICHFCKHVLLATLCLQMLGRSPNVKTGLGMLVFFFHLLFDDSIMKL